jgi:hypothetical protein|tara:strand:+ start:211 stop:396 length:186 start_codon:yes stop_codon:yes gene_type:complete
MKNNFREKQNAKGNYEIRGIYAPRELHPELKRELKTYLREKDEQANRLVRSDLDSGSAEQQ